MFLYGMNLMSDGMKAISSDRVKRILTLLTKNRIIGVLLGTSITAVIQSSSAMTVITVGLVNSGLLTLRQAIGVIMGANIGTTFTAWIVSFMGVINITNFALVIVGIGFIMTLASQGSAHRSRGQILIGLGLLFLGLNFMKDAIEPLRSNQVIMNAFITVGQNPILGLLIGMVATMILQSSSATIAIVQLLAFQGLISFDAAVPIVLGENIGTTITAQIAALGANLNARRAAMAHTLFNIFGSCYIMPLVILGIYQKFIFFILPGELSATNIMFYIAAAHSMFNIINVIILLPLISYLEKAAIWITPKGSKQFDGSPVYLDKRLLTSPAAALLQARKEMLRMAQMAREALELSCNAFVNKDTKDFKHLAELEDAIDNLQEEITGYLVEISQQKLSDAESDELPVWLHSVNDLERIGDHTENLVELTQRSIRLHTNVPEDAKQELLEMYNMIIRMGDLIILAIRDSDHDKGYKALACEDKINKLYIEFRDAQIQRLNSGVCTPHDGIIYIDVLNNLEKIADHLTNIAQAVLREFHFGHGEQQGQKHSGKSPLA